MKYQSTSSPIFLNTVERWIEESGEILVLIRFSHAAGNKSFEFFTSISSFLETIAPFHPMTCLTVFRRRQLPLRGTVDGSFIAAAIALIPDGEEYLIAGLDRIHCGSVTWFPHWAGNAHIEMREELENNQGRRVACGIYPPWLEDSEVVSSAVVPKDDGTVVCGVY